jgi:hypothetical protein
MNYRKAISFMVAGLLIYIFSFIILGIDLHVETISIAYMLVTVVRLVMFLTGGTLLSKIISVRLKNNVFDSVNETFPPEERFLNNEYSINLRPDII